MFFYGFYSRLRPETRHALPLVLDDLMPTDYACRVIDSSVEGLAMLELGFERAEAAETGRPESTARSRFRYARVMGMKEDTVRGIGFTRLAIFRPGIIVGNAHTPAWAGWLGSLVPGPFGNIDQRILGRSIAAEITLHNREAGEVTLENAAMKKLAAQCQ